MARSRCRRCSGRSTAWKRGRSKRSSKVSGSCSRTCSLPLSASSARTAAAFQPTREVALRWRFAAPLYGLLAIPCSWCCDSGCAPSGERTDDLCRFASRTFAGAARAPGEARRACPAAAAGPDHAVCWFARSCDRNGASLRRPMPLRASICSLPSIFRAACSRRSLAVAACGRKTGHCPDSGVGPSGQDRDCGFAGSAFTVWPLHHGPADGAQDAGRTRDGDAPQGGEFAALGAFRGGKAFRGTPTGGRLLVLVTMAKTMPAASTRPGRAPPTGGSRFLPPGRHPGGRPDALLDGTFVKGRDGAVVRAGGSRVAQADRSVGSTGHGDGSGLSDRVTLSRATLRRTEQKQRRQRLAERYAVPRCPALCSSPAWFAPSVQKVEIMNETSPGSPAPCRPGRGSLLRWHANGACGGQRRFFTAGDYPAALSIWLLSSDLL